MNDHIWFKEAAEDEILFRIDYERFISSCFDFREMLIVLMMLDGFDISEIALREGSSRRWITHIVKGIREKFSTFLLLIS